MISINKSPISKISALSALAICCFSAQTRSETLLGLTSGNNLVSFDHSNPGLLTSARPITGLAVGDSLVGIDYRPANSQLYGFSANKNLYLVLLSLSVTMTSSKRMREPRLLGRITPSGISRS